MPVPEDTLAEHPSPIGRKAALLLDRRRVVVGRRRSGPTPCAQCGEDTDGRVVEVMGEVDVCFLCVQVALSQIFDS